MIEFVTPAPDSQFRLVPCSCGGEPVYRHYISELSSAELWAVYCPVCGKRTSAHPVRHDAQIVWNIEALPKHKVGG